MFVLPSTSWQNAILRVPVKLSTDSTVDVYCTVLTTPAGTPRNYPGGYATDDPPGTPNGQTGWEKEQGIQAQRVIDWVTEKSLSVQHKAVVIGEFYTGPSYTDPNNVTANNLASYVPPTFAKLTNSFGLGVPDGYTPQCTFCFDNPLVNGSAGSSTWTTHVFLGGIPITQVLSATTSQKQTPVMVDPTPNDGNNNPVAAPLSTRYGLRSTVRIRP
jgi:hypothetical protein